jgi:hypothetical protein
MALVLSTFLFCYSAFILNFESHSFLYRSGYQKRYGAGALNIFVVLVSIILQLHQSI